ncbi:hypothetical protein PRZ48_004338 [Zasmidium cellare]|uniref:Uncharacterized protein n=1 Tax=Zasmidium cellare TaxID=395010 RepID=A0ABR0ERG4_ZASCE|nr:hypothetical protein PRZ48_004338 [Zasmidium cellare]
MVNKNLDPEWSFRLGTFGWSSVQGNQMEISSVLVGYEICEAVFLATNKDPDNDRCHTADKLTRAMVLHPVASGTAFIAAFVAMASGFAGSLIGGLIACLAWLFTVVVVGIDFTIFGIVKQRLDAYKKDHDQVMIEGNFAPAIWCVVAAFVFLTVGTPIVLYTCFAVRRAKRRIAAPVHAYRHGSALSASTPDDKDIYRP